MLGQRKGQAVQIRTWPVSLQTTVTLVWVWFYSWKPVSVLSFHLCCKTGWDLVLAGGRFNIPAETRYSPTEGVALSHWKAPGTIPWHVPNYGSQLTISPSKASLVIGPLTLLITLVSLGLNRDPALEIQQYPRAREELTGCRWDLKAEQHWEPHSHRKIEEDESTARESIGYEVQQLYNSAQVNNIRVSHSLQSPASASWPRQRRMSSWPM